MSDTHTLGKHTGRLELPDSFALRRDVEIAFFRTIRHSNLAVYAALGVCWRGPGLEKCRIDYHDYNVLSYGGEVFEIFAAAGAATGEIEEAGYAAFAMITASRMKDEGVTKAENFTEATADPSTS